MEHCQGPAPPLEERARTKERGTHTDAGASARNLSDSEGAGVARQDEVRRRCLADNAVTRLAPLGIMPAGRNQQGYVPLHLIRRRDGQEGIWVQAHYSPCRNTKEGLPCPLALALHYFRPWLLVSVGYPGNFAVIFCNCVWLAKVHFGQPRELERERRGCTSADCHVTRGVSRERLVADAADAAPRAQRVHDFWCGLNERW